jgi:hypothetical protein
MHQTIVCDTPGGKEYAIANDQSAMSRPAGGFLDGPLADVGVASAAPELTEDVALGPSDLLRSGPSAAVLRGAASAGRDRGSGADFRSTCGIGIGGTNLSSLCATGIANGAKKPGAGGGTSGAARAGRTLPPAPANKDKTSWPGMLLRPRYPLPPETKWQRPCK